METSRRLAWLLFLLGVGLFLGILFRDFILANFVLPVAMVLVLLWRIVLSVDQAIYWGLLILAAAGVACYRLARAVVNAGEVAPLASDTILRNIDLWRMSIMASSGEGGASNVLKRDLAQLLVALYVSKQPEAMPFDLYDALRLRQVPMPPLVYTFLFPSESLTTGPFWKQRLRQLAETPRKWVRQWTGRDQIEYYQAVEATLAFMESIMETQHGPDYINSSDH